MRSLLKESLFLTGLVRALRQAPLDYRRWRWWRAQKTQIKAYLQNHAVRKLQVGSGKNLLPGWLNTDYRPSLPEHVYLDATRRFPLPDASFDYVFSEHVLEHLWHKDGMNFLRESHRILKPGGKLRISTPNLANILSLANPKPTEIQKRYIQVATDKYIPENTGYRASFVINNFFWDFNHYFVFDAETLTADLEAAGFRSIQRCAPGESDDVNLAGIEWHGKVVGEEINAFETMVFQAIR